MDITGNPTSLAAVAVLAIGLILKDWAANRGKVAREDTKVDELSKQTLLLIEIRDINKTSAKKTKKMAKQIKELHEKHIPKT